MGKDGKSEQVPSTFATALFFFVIVEQVGSFQSGSSGQGSVDSQFNENEYPPPSAPASKPQHPLKTKDAKGQWTKVGQTHLMASGTPANHWGYGPENGPDRWKEMCQDGRQQSPIDIRASDVEYAFINPMHFVNYEKAGRIQVKNVGHGVQIDGFEQWNAEDQPYIYGGNLTGRYYLAQFHFHWSFGHDDGSEHTVNSLHYPAEVHFVHTKEGYSMNELYKQPDGLAVVGIFLIVGQDGSAWTTLKSGLEKVVKKGDSQLVFSYAPYVNLPNVDNFYRYSGSLTTPGCNEAVIWTIMLNLLRSMQMNDGQRLDFNNRPTQPLNGRRIYYRSQKLNRKAICQDTFVKSAAIQIVYNLGFTLMPLFICLIYN